MAILLCSANTMVRQRWHSLLTGKRDLVEVDSLNELQSVLPRHLKGLLLLHRSMVDLQTAVAIRKAAPQAKVFLLSDRPDEEEGLEFIKIGIVGYANTYISAARLAEAVRIVSSGSVWIGQKVMQRLIMESAATMAKKPPAQAQTEETGPATSDRLASLTSREVEIARLVAKGLSNLEVAARLDITERTVKAHLSSIYTKTGTGSRLNLALLVNKSGESPLR